MALPARADVRELLGRIRRGADYRWKGGAINDESLVDWRDRTQIEPTEAEYLTELAIVDAEKATETATRADMRSRSAAAVGGLFSALSTAEITALVEELVFQAGGLNDQGEVKNIDDWSNAE